MSDRLEYWKLAGDALGGLGMAHKAIAGAGLPAHLLNLLYLRISQINGCAYCLHTHSHDALAEGETPERLALIAGWREAGDRFSSAERAALAWAEAMTRFADGGAGSEAEREAAYAAVRGNFDERQTAYVGMAIALMNAFNRVAVGFNRAVPGGPA